MIMSLESGVSADGHIHILLSFCWLYVQSLGLGDVKTGGNLTSYEQVFKPSMRGPRQYQWQMPTSMEFLEVQGLECPAELAAMMAIIDIDVEQVLTSSS